MILDELTNRWQVLRFWREHQSLRQLELVRRVADAGGAAPSPLRQRDYLVRGLSARERMRCALAHYRFEDATFGAAYQQAVYGGAGLALWQHAHEGDAFALELTSTPHNDAEGSLSIALTVNGATLHRLSWTWIEGALFDIALPIVPFISRNEGRWHASEVAFDAFERAFPNNSPSFFCFAALQGLAQQLGIDRVLAVRAVAHVAFDAGQDETQARAFENTYDGFWRILGGAERDARSYLIALPFYLKPLQDMPSKHRKRAAQRREQWRAIGDATRATLVRIDAPRALPLPAAADEAEAVQA